MTANTQAVLSDLTRVKALFQLRTIAMILDERPQPHHVRVRPASA